MQLARPFPRGAPALLALALAACSETGVGQLNPTLAVSPGVLDFGQVGPPLSDTKRLTVSNAGTGILHVSGAYAGDPEFTAELVDLDLAAGEDAQVNVTYVPRTYEANHGEITFTTTNDLEHPTLVVPIEGVGVDLPFGEIEIRPAPYVDAPDVEPTTTQQLSFQVWNVGDGDLVFTAPSTIEAATLPNAFTIALDAYLAPNPDLAYLEPGGFTFVAVDYTPADLGGDAAIVHVYTSDPWKPDEQVLLNGNGAVEPPVAVIDCPAEVDLAGPQTFFLWGDDSYDPGDFDPLTYKWTELGRPPGSNDKPLDPDYENKLEYYVDVVGTYGVQLVVANRFGVESAPAECWFDAKPADAIHVELTWSTETADIDLHFTQGGSDPFDDPEDCTWCNPNPDWGGNGADDDPRLDLDARGGMGPENINLYAPVTGTYDVWVHYFDDGTALPCTATVKVWLDGTLAYEESQVVELHDLWHVGLVDWSAAPVFRDSPDAHTTQPERNCGP